VQQILSGCQSDKLPNKFRRLSPVIQKKLADSFGNRKGELVKLFLFTGKILLIDWEKKSSSPEDKTLTL
jgi:hypothetical protein